MNRPSQISGVQGIAWPLRANENADPAERATGLLLARFQGEKVLKTSVILSCFAVAACLLVGTRGNNSVVASPAVQDKSTKSDSASTNMVQAEMRNVMYHISDKIVAHIRMLSGGLEPIGGRDMPVLDDKNSFYLRIANAEIAVNTSSLTNAFNSYVFCEPEVTVERRDNDNRAEEIESKGTTARKTSPHMRRR